MSTRATPSGAWSAAAISATEQGSRHSSTMRRCSNRRYALGARGTASIKVSTRRPSCRGRVRPPVIMKGRTNASSLGTADYPGVDNVVVALAVVASTDSAAAASSDGGRLSRAVVPAMGADSSCTSTASAAASRPTT